MQKKKNQEGGQHFFTPLYMCVCVCVCVCVWICKCKYTVYMNFRFLITDFVILANVIILRHCWSLSQERILSCSGVNIERLFYFNVWSLNVVILETRPSLSHSTYCKESVRESMSVSCSVFAMWCLMESLPVRSLYIHITQYSLINGEAEEWIL